MAERVNVIETRLAGQYDRLCREPDQDVGKEELVLSAVAHFPDGKYMAIEVIGPQDPKREPCWTQGTLYDEDGRKIGFTPPRTSFTGEYVVCDGEEVYKAVIRRPEEG